MPQIFLCHASEDKPKVREVYRRLKDEGFQPWLDEEDLLPGQLWEQEIPKALKASDFILIFFSQHAVSREGYVQREFKLALEAWQEIPEGRIHTIPLRLDDCTIPDQSSKFQWVDFSNERGLERINDQIEGIGTAAKNVSGIAETATKIAQFAGLTMRTVAPFLAGMV